jgi:N-acetylgalactosamine-N,N'-diacetylbacillosaminyl-diphospho-undecaprenol 4-alpha-N-acetylgalactosaminyltransferase
LNKKKIALVGFRLSGGGSDRVMANLSKFFHEKGFDVHIIIFHDEIGYSYFGKIFNLGKLKSERNTIFNKIKRFYHFNKYIKKQDFNFIIDFRFRINSIQELFISKYIYSKYHTYYTVHSSKINHYMPDDKLLTGLIYGNNHEIVVVANTIKHLVEEKHQLKNVSTIYNPIDIDQISMKVNVKIELDYDYIISAGSFDTKEKQFDKLILAYSKSILPKMNIALVILGDGVRKEELMQIAKTNNVGDKVFLLGFKKNPYKYFSKAKFFVLSSKYEGMPMVLLESLASGIPVISFDCLTGPKEIIENGYNGLLIENQNIDKLIEGIDKMIKNETLYLTCKNNAKSSIEKFHLKTIGNQWLDKMNIKY